MSELKMSELKPCPFCGGEAGVSQGCDRVGRAFSFVACEKCFCRTVEFYEWQYNDARRAKAIETWNRRVDNG